MSADLEREAREAALLSTPMGTRYDEDLCCYDNDSLRDEFVLGYLAVATLREEEIAQLRTSLMLTEANFDSAIKEIEELRALLREACKILNDAIKTDETFWLEEMRGTNEDLTERIMLMVPPIPVPETKVNASQQGA